MHLQSLNHQKRKNMMHIGTWGDCYGDGGYVSCSSRTLPDKKQNHSKIEKRRRDKMNTYISELSSLIPMCGGMARKLDKLTVLRIAVQHLRSVMGSLSPCPLTARPRPAFLFETELNSLILQASHNSFLLVVGCDRGKLKYVSTTVKKILLYDQSELIGQNLFDILHPKDVAKVKEQLSSSDLSPRERFIDAKTMLPVKADVVSGASRLSPGSRRSFFCRIKFKVPSNQNTGSVKTVNEDPEFTCKLRKKHSYEKKYCVVQCTGYLKSWTPGELLENNNPVGNDTDDGEACNDSCLVAVVRTLDDLTTMSITPSSTTPTRPLEYISRHAIDGKFIFVDQRVTLALGFLPQELLGTSLYEYVSDPEIKTVAHSHKSALLHGDALQTPTYSFRKKDGTLATIQTHLKPFRNPWTKDVECLVANNTVLLETHLPPQQDAEQINFEVLKQKPDFEMQHLIDSQVESHKISSAIVDEILHHSPNEYSPDLSSDLLQEAVFNEQVSLEDNMLDLEVPGCMDVLDNVPLSNGGVNDFSPQIVPAIDLPVGIPPPLSPPLSIDGNGEATMTVIMSLLEADAGLGGPMNFSGLPWPLP